MTRLETGPPPVPGTRPRRSARSALPAGLSRPAGARRGAGAQALHRRHAPQRAAGADLGAAAAPARRLRHHPRRAAHRLRPRRHRGLRRRPPERPRPLGRQRQGPRSRTPPGSRRLMEAIERWHAERPVVPLRFGEPADLTALGRTADARRPAPPPRGRARPARLGRRRSTSRPARRRSCRSTSSHTCWLAGVAHVAVLHLDQRPRLRHPPGRGGAARALRARSRATPSRSSSACRPRPGPPGGSTPARSTTPAVAGLLARLAGRGFALALWDATTDVGVADAALRPDRHARRRAPPPASAPAATPTAASRRSGRSPRPPRPAPSPSPAPATTSAPASTPPASAVRFRRAHRKRRRRPGPPVAGDPDRVARLPARRPPRRRRRGDRAPAAARCSPSTSRASPGSRSSASSSPASSRQRRPARRSPAAAPPARAHARPHLRMAAVVFVGPSLAGAPRRAAAGRAPPRPAAEAGDLYRAARAGARVIGLVDGVFEDRPTVWHKEILWALERGVRVIGAASLGALRAAECAPFGMEGVGAIFAPLRDGAIEDDSDLAVVHAPARARLAAADRGARQRPRHPRRRRRGRRPVPPRGREPSRARAAALPFRELTWRRARRGPDPARARALAAWLPARPGRPQARRRAGAARRRRRRGRRRRRPPRRLPPRRDPLLAGRGRLVRARRRRTAPEERRSSTSSASTRRASSARWSAPSPAAPPPATRSSRRRRRPPTLVDDLRLATASPPPPPSATGCAAARTEPAALAAALAAEERLRARARGRPPPRSRRRCSTRCASTGASTRSTPAPPTSARASPAAPEPVFRETELAALVAALCARAGSRSTATTPTSSPARSASPTAARCTACSPRARTTPAPPRGDAADPHPPPAPPTPPPRAPHCACASSRSRPLAAPAAARDHHPLAARREVGPGPSDRRMYTIEPPASRPTAPTAGRPTVPPWRGPIAPRPCPRPDGHFDHLAPGDPGFRPVHLYGCVRFALDVWEGYLGRPIPWHFARHFARLELVALGAGTNAHMGYGYLEVGERPLPAARSSDYCLNFDVIAHEVGHALMMTFAGRFSPDRVTADYEALHEASADWAAMIASLHLDRRGRGAARDDARRPRHRQPPEPLRRALLDPARSASPTTTGRCGTSPPAGRTSTTWRCR